MQSIEDRIFTNISKRGRGSIVSPLDYAGYGSSKELAYGTSFFSKTNSEWIKYINKEDDEILYFPYYSESEREIIFNSFNKQAITEIEDEYWHE